MRHVCRYIELTITPVLRGEGLQEWDLDFENVTDRGTAIAWFPPAAENKMVSRLAWRQAYQSSVK